jgi:hypothetical protein
MLNVVTYLLASPLQLLVAFLSLCGPDRIERFMAGLMCCSALSLQGTALSANLLEPPRHAGLRNALCWDVECLGAARIAGACVHPSR